MPPPLDLADPAAVADAFRVAADANLHGPSRRGSVDHLPDHGRLIVTGDLHDHALNFRRILKLAALDADPDRHLILQELIHGESRVNDADLSIRMLARGAELKQRYPGQVTVLLSNHELAQANGEQIMKDGQSVTDAFTRGIEYLYGAAADDVWDAAHRYIRSLPLAARGPHGVMISHSLPAPRAIERFDKAVLDRPLTEQDLSPRGAAYDMVWGRHQNRKITHELAEAWGVGAFVLGHQPPEMGFDTLTDHVLLITSEHGHGQALVLDLAASYSRDELLDHLRPLASVLV